ncbi:MAG: helix-turn-helix domain-containing protein [Rickettsiales bacterium]
MEIHNKNQIKNLRESYGLTLEQLAERAGTTNQQISMLEKGQRKLTWDWMVRLAKALNCRPIDIVEETVDFSNEEIMDAIKNKETHEVIQKFNNLSETQKAVFTTMLDGISNIKDDEFKEKLLKEYKNKDDNKE